MKKVFYLKTCGTNKKIMADKDLSDWELREIKSEPITKDELAEMYAKTKSYEALFSKKSTQIKARGIDVKSLQEKDFKKLLISLTLMMAVTWRCQPFGKDNRIFMYLM